MARKWINSKGQVKVGRKAEFAEYFYEQAVPFLEQHNFEGLGLLLEKAKLLDNRPPVRKVRPFRTMTPARKQWIRDYNAAHPEASEHCIAVAASVPDGSGVTPFETTQARVSEVLHPPE